MHPVTVARYLRNPDPVAAPGAAFQQHKGAAGGKAGIAAVSTPAVDKETRHHRQATAIESRRAIRL